MAGITQNKQKALFSLRSLNKNSRNNNNIDDSNKTNNNNNNNNNNLTGFNVVSIK